MIKYYQFGGLLLDAFEWAGGYGRNHKFVMKEQAARKREVKRGFARVVTGD